MAKAFEAKTLPWPEKPPPPPGRKYNYPIGNLRNAIGGKSAAQELQGGGGAAPGPVAAPAQQEHAEPEPKPLGPDQARADLGEITAAICAAIDQLRRTLAADAVLANPGHFSEGRIRAALRRIEGDLP